MDRCDPLYPREHWDIWGWENDERDKVLGGYNENAMSHWAMQAKRHATSASPDGTLQGEQSFEERC